MTSCNKNTYLIITLKRHSLRYELVDRDKEACENSDTEM